MKMQKKGAPRLLCVAACLPYSPKLPQCLPALLSACPTASLPHRLPAPLSAYPTPSCPTACMHKGPTLPHCHCPQVSLASQLRTGLELGRPGLVGLLDQLATYCAAGATEAKAEEEEQVKDGLCNALFLCLCHWLWQGQGQEHHTSRCRPKQCIRL